MAYDHVVDRRSCLLPFVFFGAFLAAGWTTAWAVDPPIPPATCPSSSNDIPNEHKFDCLPGFNLTITEKECLARGCCWQEVGNQNKSGPYIPGFPDDRFPIHVGAPLCYYPDKYPSYITLNHSTTPYGMIAFLERNAKPAFVYPDDVNLIRMDVYMEDQKRLRVKISDPLHDRYEVPVPQLPTIDEAATDTDYIFNFNADTASFTVARKSTKEVIFDTSVGSFVFANHFIQLSALLPTTNLYGLGQHNDNFRRSFDWQLIPLFASLLYPDYGSHPFYLALEKTSMSHGVFLFNSNAMDVLLQPTPAITYRTTGGILDFYFFLGDTPEVVIEQYTNLIGKPVLPPYWSLGFQLSRYGYGSSEKTRETWTRNVQAGIPLDVQWNDIDYLNKFEDFTYDPVNFKGLPQLVDDIHSKHMKYVMITDSGVAVPPEGEVYPMYDDGMQLDIFIKNGSGTGYATGKVWPPITVFPDFTNPATQFFWESGYRRLYKDIKFDGAWIDMDEPSTFTHGSVENEGCPHDEELPYTPAVEGGSLSAYTICMSSQHQNDIHFNLHNLYGFTEGIATNKALRNILNKRPFVMSRSTFPGFGHYGTHWTGDVYSKWHDLKQSIPAILNFNMYGIPMVGSDICGFRTNTTLELCQRWTTLGAFYPFARNHNAEDTIEQDPVALGTVMVDTTIKAMQLRYNFLPYMYTQLFNAHLYGGTVIRPLFFEFPLDPVTHGMDEQFLWGRDLLVLPVLEEKTTSTQFYLPQALWYMWPEMSIIDSPGAWYKFDVELDEIVIGVRGGAIHIEQPGSQTTYESRRNKFALTVALDHKQKAIGELYWDDGESLDPIENNAYTHINFMAVENMLMSDVDLFNYPGDEPMILDFIQVLGLPAKPDYVSVNSHNITFNYENRTLWFSGANILLRDSFMVNWGPIVPPTMPPPPYSTAVTQSTPLGMMVLFIIAAVIGIYHQKVLC